MPLEEPRHEAFCQLVADGATFCDAYAEVYDCSPSTARREAYRVSRLPLVRARVDALKWQNAEVKALSRERKLQILAKIAENTLEDPRARIAAIAESNKMTGDAKDQNGPLEVKVTIEGRKGRNG